MEIMDVLDKIKLIAELITSIATALIVVKHLGKLCNPIRNFFKITIPAFFIGYVDNGKKTRFFKGLKLRRERNNNIIKAIATNVEMEEVLVLDKKALFDIISNSGAFQKLHLRKN